MNNEDILIALKEIHARYCIPASERNYTDKDYACMQYEKLVIHLSNQLNKKKEVLDKIKKKVNQYEFISGYYDDNYDGEDTTYSHDTLKEEILELLGGYMETIKVIDLLNKIANGEEVPKKFRIKGSCFKDLYYEYNEKYNCYDLIGEKFKYGCYVFGYSELNDEIEIIEDTPEDKKIEKLNNKIDKAIEYITSNEWAKDYKLSSCRTHLLDILRGDNNEESN